MNRDNRKENNGGWKIDVRSTDTGMEKLGRWKMTAIGDCRIQGWV